MREIHAFFLFHLEDADPVDLRVARLVVLRHAGIHATAAADAAGNVQRIGEKDARYGTGVGDLNVFAELLLVLALHFGDGRLEPVFRRFVEAFGTAGGENHACGCTCGGLSEQAEAYHRRLSWVISWSDWEAAARVWAPARGNAAGADCGSSRIAGRFWRRSSCRCGGHELRRANPDT